MREFSRTSEVRSVGTGMTNFHREGEMDNLLVYAWKLESLKIVRVQGL